MKKFKKICIVTIIILLIIIVILGVITVKNKGIINIVNTGIDDWKYKESSSSSDYVLSGVSTDCMSATTSSIGGISESVSSPKTNSNIGYTVGGASNVDSFRENINNGYFPISTDITYNGLYSEYYFNTKNIVTNTNSEDMFYPTYSTAVSTDPLSQKQEQYISVGLNSNLKESDFKRKKLNLVIVLDISGSMSSSFSSYYYDGKINNTENKSKMKIAEESINNLLDKLNKDDRFGVILFDNQAYLGKSISKVSDTDMSAIKEHILEINPQGGTNFSVGYDKATSLFSEYLNDDEYQNRIVVITDAMPNAGTTSAGGLMNTIEENSKKKIYTSLIGVGVDFNTELTEKISNVTGANYYSVHDSSEFNKILAEEFDYMVTPLIFNLDLKFESDDYEIENIYGTDSADKSSGNIMYINTLFPSSSNSDGEVKGGIIVLKIKRKENSNSNNINLKISYTDVNGKIFSNQQKIEFKQSLNDYYDNTGIRKAIVLARYVNTLKNWIIYERTNNKSFIINENTGIKELDNAETDIKRYLNTNESASTKLSVSEEFQETFKKVKKYIESENEILKDDTINNEIKILNKLI